MTTRCIPTAPTFFSLLLLAAICMTINGCGATPKNSAVPSVDEALESTNHVARSAFEKGMYKQAAGIYQTVLEMAYVRNDPGVILNTRYNLAICLMELERYPEAIKLVNQVHEELLVENESMPLDLLLLEATIFYRNNQMDDSWKTTEKILAGHTSSSPTIKAKTYFLRGLIASDRQDIAGIRESMQKMGQPESLVVQSARIELQGRLAMAENRWDQAITFLDQATRLRREVQDYRRMAITLALSAAASEKTGNTVAAAAGYLQAGRSAAFRDDRSNARKWLTQAAVLFKQAGNDALTAESKALLSALDDK